MKSHRILVGLLVLGIVSLGACSDDDGDTSTAGQPGTTVDDGTVDNGSTADGGSADLAAFCDAHRDLGPAFLSQDVDAVAGAVGALRDAAPEEVAGALEPVAAAIERDGRAAFESEEFLEAEAAAEAVVDELTLEECEGERLEIEGVDYRFEGVPETLEPGRYILDFTNGSSSGEAHEAILVRRNDGVDASAEELLMMSDAERSELTTPVGLAAADQSDPRDVSVIDLDPGEYIMVCTLPVGGEDASPDAPPHAAEGMLQEFTVG